MSFLHCLLKVMRDIYFVILLCWQQSVLQSQIRGLIFYNQGNLAKQKAHAGNMGIAKSGAGRWNITYQQQFQLDQIPFATIFITIAFFRKRTWSVKKFLLIIALVMVWFGFFLFCRKRKSSISGRWKIWPICNGRLAKSTNDNNTGNLVSNYCTTIRAETTTNR